MKTPKPPSALEAALSQHIRAAKLPEPEREYRFDVKRRWRFDMAWPALMVAVECEGGTYSGGRHVTAVGFENDAEKYNAAVLQGWRVLRFTGHAIKAGTALATIEAILKVPSDGLEILA